MGSDRYKELKLNYKIWFTDQEDNGILGDGKWKILKAIDEAGSLTAACEKLGITYRRTWNDLKTIEKQLGFALLEKTRGGVEGGSTSLTPEGKKLIQAFDDFHEKMDVIMQQHFIELKNMLLENE